MFYTKCSKIFKCLHNSKNCTWGLAMVYLRRFHSIWKILIKVFLLLVENLCISETSLHFRRPAPTWSMRRGSHRQSTSPPLCYTQKVRQWDVKSLSGQMLVCHRPQKRSLFCLDCEKRSTWAPPEAPALLVPTSASDPCHLVRTHV